MNFRITIYLVSISIGLLLSSCSSTSFEDQIKNDIVTEMTTGICDSIPKDASVSNIKVGEIVDIGMQGMTDVSIEFDYEVNGVKKHHSSAMLYVKQGRIYKLASLGGCEFKMK